MLQQTRASVVISYFLRWMDLFPTLEALATAPLERVIKAWEGLGYYSRARNLHSGAKEILERFEGKVPEERAQLQTIRGLGPYTIGAILSFGFQKRAAAIDGNTSRVLSRYFCVEENICRQRGKKKIEAHCEEILDEKEPWVTVEALIELGATVCTPKPRCSLCPLQAQCAGFLKNRAELLPIKNAAPETTALWRSVAVIEAEEKVLVRKREKGELFADLYEFPFFEKEKGKQLVKEIKKSWGFAVLFERRLSETAHTFTRYKARLFPELLRGKQIFPVEGHCWISREELSSLPFSAGHRKIAQEYLCTFST